MLSSHRPCTRPRASGAHSGRRQRRKRRRATTARTGGQRVGRDGHRRLREARAAEAAARRRAEPDDRVLQRLQRRHVLLPRLRGRLRDDDAGGRRKTGLVCRTRRHDMQQRGVREPPRAAADWAAGDAMRELDDPPKVARNGRGRRAHLRQPAWRAFLEAAHRFLLLPPPARSGEGTSKRTPRGPQGGAAAQGPTRVSCVVQKCYVFMTLLFRVSTVDTMYFLIAFFQINGAAGHRGATPTGAGEPALAEVSQPHQLRSRLQPAAVRHKEPLHLTVPLTPLRKHQCVSHQTPTFSS